MSKPKSSVIHPDEDPDLFRAAVSFTAAETAFPARLIEKDYFCTLLLRYLAASNDTLVFRGGTCLAKVHAGFYRLSEDLDFVLPVPITASRAERSARAARMREAVAALPGELLVLRVVQALTGANRSTQYTAVAAYTSLLSRQNETIAIEIGIREPLLTPVLNGSAQTILLDPISGRPLVEAAAVNCISKTEAFAEKFRAALTRRDVAIRDFYDIDYAVRRLGIRPQDNQLVELVRQKLAVPGNESVDVSDNRLAALRQQLESRLKPVLRQKDFAEFDLEQAFRTVAQMAAQVL